ncbi:hypothetical protein ACFY4C_15015 [Actinomadura viridis]|uniref:hypothetical protein n=1 Tax=Actinomadura viridis TaxID=58110 RepID=UPI00367501D3
MDLKDATRMILVESAAHPELLRVSRQSHEELASGGMVEHTTLSWMLREAARKGVFPALKGKHGDRAFDDLVTVLCREIDRQAPVVRR